MARWFPGWLFERFGDHCVQISVDTTLKLRSAVHDVSRFLRGHVPADIIAWSKQFEMPPQGMTDVHFVLGYSNEEEIVPGSIERDACLQAYVHSYPQDWEIVKKALGLGRQKGRHACGMVFGNMPISEFIPLTSVSGVTVTSYDSEAVEAVGGLKMDFLGVNAIKDIGDCVRLIQSRTDRAGARAGMVLDPVSGKDVYVWNLPEHPPVFIDICEGRTETMFQLNTSGAVKLLRNFNHLKADGTKGISSVKDIAAFTALDRPGPLQYLVDDPEKPGQQHNMLVEYAHRATGRAPSTGILPVMSDLCPETHGIMCFQELLQRVYQEVTGCSGPEAEDFRNNVAKKKMEKINAAYPKFMARATERFGKEAAEELWASFKPWAKYGFNKAHATCYAIIAYATAWLKHHYPLEWWCAVLRNAPKDKIDEVYWQHCWKLVDMPDVRMSGSTWQIVGTKIRAPLSLLHGIGPAAHAQLIEDMPYETIEGFTERVATYPERHQTTETTTGEDGAEVSKTKKARNGLTRGTIHALLTAGAMDALFPPETPLDEQVAAYDRCMRTLLGAKKYRTTLAQKHKSMNPLERYQSRKMVLHMWGADLRPIIALRELPSFLKKTEASDLLYVRTAEDRYGESYTTEDAVISGESYAQLVAIQGGGTAMRCALIGYVEDVRKFQYKREEVPHEAADLTFEVGGDRFRIAKFPNGKNKDVYPDEVPQSGAIAAVLLYRSASSNRFTITEAKTLAGPLQKEKDEDTEAKS